VYVGDNPSNWSDPSGLCGQASSRLKPPPCKGTSFVGEHGTAVVTFTRKMKYGNTPRGKFAWYFEFTPSMQGKLRLRNATQISVWISRAKVNGRSVASPYPPGHVQRLGYNFHSSLGPYGYIGRKGGGNLKRGDVLYLRWNWETLVRIGDEVGVESGSFEVTCTVN